MTVLLRPQGLTALLMGRFGNALLWLFAALHLAALSILLMTLLTLSDANAAEQQADACGGSDILVEMQKTDPQAYAAILAEAQKSQMAKARSGRSRRMARTPPGFSAPCTLPIRAWSICQRARKKPLPKPKP